MVILPYTMCFEFLRKCSQIPIILSSQPLLFGGHLRARVATSREWHLSSPMFSVNFTNRKNSAVLNYHKSWSWSNQPVLWVFYIMFLLVSSLWMFVTMFCPKHAVTGDVWRHNILTFHTASAETGGKSLHTLVGCPASGAEIHFNIILLTLWWKKKAFLYNVILTLRWCIEIISSFIRSLPSSGMRNLLRI